MFYFINIWAMFNVKTKLKKKKFISLLTNDVIVRMRTRGGRSFPVGQEEEKGGHRNIKR